MSMDAFEDKEAMMLLLEKLLYAEQQRLDGEPSFTLDEVEQRLKNKISGMMDL